MDEEAGMEVPGEGRSAPAYQDIMIGVNLEGRMF